MSLDRHLIGTVPQTREAAVLQLYLWFPIVIDRAVVPFLDQEGIPFERSMAENRLRFELPEPQLARMLLGLGDRLSVEESMAIKALRLPPERQLAVSDLSKVTSLRELIVLYRSRWLQNLLIKRQLTTHFQPIVHAADPTRLYGHEALMRGVTEDSTIIPPLRLLAFARDAQMLVQLNQAAQQAALMDLGRHGLKHQVFINFNPSEGDDPFLSLHMTCRMIDELKLDARRFVFEISELDPIADVEAFRELMLGFRQAGYRFALDDVGAGYASLNLLHQLQPEFIKIDMGIVRGVHQDAHKAAIARHLIGLAQDLGIQAIAEGVECREELAWLQAVGVDFIQGFLIGRPAAPPADPRDMQPVLIA